MANRSLKVPWSARFDQETIDRIREMAEQMGMSQAQIIKLAVELMASNQQENEMEQQQVIEGLKMNGKCACGRAHVLTLTTWYRCIDTSEVVYHVKTLPVVCECGRVIDVIELDNDLDLFWNWLKTVKIDRL